MTDKEKNIIKLVANNNYLEEYKINDKTQHHK